MGPVGVTYDDQRVKSYINGDSYFDINATSGLVPITRIFDYEGNSSVFEEYYSGSLEDGVSTVAIFPLTEDWYDFNYTQPSLSFVDLNDSV